MNSVEVSGGGGGRLSLDLVSVLDLVVVFEDIGELGQQFELLLGENAGEMFRSKSHEFRLRRAPKPTLENSSATARERNRETGNPEYGKHQNDDLICFAISLGGLP